MHNQQTPGRHLAGWLRPSGKSTVAGDRFPRCPALATLLLPISLNPNPS